MNTVGQILKTKGSQVWTISKDATVADAAKILVEKRVGAVLVMEGDSLAGIFTERDLVNKVSLSGRNPAEISLDEVMTHQVVTVTPADTVNTCMALMTDRHFRHLPVVQDGKLAGILSIGDVVKDIIEELQFMVNQFERYIQGLR